MHNSCELAVHEFGYICDDERIDQKEGSIERDFPVARQDLCEDVCAARVRPAFMPIPSPQSIPPKSLFLQ